MTEMLVKMSLAVGLMCALTAILWLLLNRTGLKTRGPWCARLLVGLTFGGAAAVSTHMGVDYNAMILNVRDIAPLSAGLLFDPWAGVIAGFVGGLERFVVGQWFGTGAYTRVACGISTFLAGLLPLLLRKALFDGKKPTPAYSFAIGGVMEVFHMLAILLTHMEDMSEAYAVVKVCAAPMIGFTAVGVMLSTVIVSVFSGQYRKSARRREKSQRPISRTFQLWLLLFVVVAFALTFSFIFVAQTRLTLDNARSLLLLNAQDFLDDLKRGTQNLESSNRLQRQQARMSALTIADSVRYAQQRDGVDSETLDALKQTYGLYEINFIDENGVITASTNRDYIDFDMASGAQSAEFLALLTGEKNELVQDFQPISYDASVSVMYIGVAIPGGFVQVGYDSVSISAFSSLTDLSAVAQNRRIGESGFALLLSRSGGVLSGDERHAGRTLADMGVSQLPAPGQFTFLTLDGEECLCYCRQTGDFSILLCLPSRELYSERDIFAYEIAFMEVLLFAAIFVLVFELVKLIVVKNLHRVNRSLARITGGDLSVVVDVRTNAEFSSLSQDINQTVDTLKRYIAEAESRIDRELELAREIQHSALPADAPAALCQNAFDLAADMRTAKQVGGDFYDYFPVGAGRVAFVMADVSGKGIPAALFMMKSKTLIKSLAEDGTLTPAQVMEQANRQLCEGNDAEMFVTVWLGILELASGKMVCSNAAHEYPILKRAGGDYEILRDRHGFILGGMQGSRYREYDLTLCPGDKLFLYTDGVTEATDGENQLYGMDRVVAVLNARADASPRDTLRGVQEDIDRFVGDAPQFDDITMMSLQMRGGAQTLNVPARAESLEGIQQKVAEAAREAGAPARAQSQLALAVEEVFVNIVSYAYPEGEGTCEVEIRPQKNGLALVFRDGGTPYNPLEKPDPDVSLEADARDVGGLGIFLTKKLMDEVTYRHEDGCNLLTLVKRWPAPLA